MAVTVVNAFIDRHLNDTINRTLQITDTIAVYNPAERATIYIRVCSNEDINHLMDHISKLDDYEIIEPCWLDQPLFGNSKLERIINWHIKHGKTLVVRDNNDNSVSTHTFPHELGYFWSPKDVKEMIESIGWYDLETLRDEEALRECVERMPPRFPNDYR
jgi:hypothetical protein